MGCSGRGAASECFKMMLTGVAFDIEFIPVESFDEYKIVSGLRECNASDIHACIFALRS